MSIQISELRALVLSMIASAKEKPASTDPIIQHDAEIAAHIDSMSLSGLQCSRKEYVSTTTSIAQIFKTHAITNTTSDSFKRINVIKGALSTAGLMTLLEGHRVKPIETEDNEFGYSRRRKVLVEYITDTGAKDTKYIYLENDDTYLYTFDNGRLFQAMMDIFDENLHYLVPTEIINSDGRGMYVKIMAHLNGQRSKDADKARYALDNYKFNESVTFKVEHARFTELMRHYEYCQMKEMTNKDKMAFLVRNVYLDTRLGMRECMVSAKMQKLSYEETIQSLITINMEMPDSLQVVKMANVSTINYCHKFNNGNCPFGESCRYEHKIDPNHIKKEFNNNYKGNKDNNNKSMPYNANPKIGYNKFKKQIPSNTSSIKTSNTSTPVTKSNRTEDKQNSSIPRGVKSETNPLGWSNSQQLAIKMMEDSTSFTAMKVISIAADNDISTISTPTTSLTSFSSWGEPLKEPFKPEKIVVSTIRMNMMKVDKTPTIKYDVTRRNIRRKCNVMSTSSSKDKPIIKNESSN